MLRQFDAQNGWNTGFLSCAHWLSWRTGIDMGAAREKVRVAKALTALPRLSGALQRGEISYAKVRALTRVATPEQRRAAARSRLHGHGRPGGTRRAGVAPMRSVGRSARGPAALSGALGHDLRGRGRHGRSARSAHAGARRGGAASARRGRRAAVPGEQGRGGPRLDRRRGLVDTAPRRRAWAPGRMRASGRSRSRSRGDRYQVVLHVDAGAPTHDT